MTELSDVRELAQASGFLGVFSTVRPDGTVHSSLVSAGIIDDPSTGQPCVGVVVGGGAKKLEFLRRSGRATVLFKDGWLWAAVEGPVRLEGPDDPASDGSDRAVPDVVRAVYQAAGGSHDDWDEFDRVMAEDRRCAVFITTDRLSSNPGR
jgi:hypothetical protein